MRSKLAALVRKGSVKRKGLTGRRKKSVTEKAVTRRKLTRRKRLVGRKKSKSQKPLVTTPPIAERRRGSLIYDGGLNPDHTVRWKDGPAYFGLGETRLREAIVEGLIPKPLAVVGARAKAWFGWQIKEWQKEVMAKGGKR
jgi:hypothetical protein